MKIFYWKLIVKVKKYTDPIIVGFKGVKLLNIWWDGIYPILIKKSKKVLLDTF